MISKGEWKRANKCQKYLKVVTVACITSGFGKFIDTNMLTGIIQLDRIRDFYWSNQGRPTISDWIVWIKVLKYSMLGPQGALKKPEGMWIHKIEEMYKNK